MSIVAYKHVVLWVFLFDIVVTLFWLCVDEVRAPKIVKEGQMVSST